MVQSIYHPDLTEIERFEKLKALEILDTPEEHEFDAIVMLAQRLLDMPIVLVSLVDDHRQWFKAKCGVTVSGTSRDISFCTHAIHVDDMLVIEDATLDPRFVNNPLVTGEPHIRFYAGVPLRPAVEGFSDDLPGIGTLCAIDTKPRTLSEEDARTLREIAGLVSSLIRARSTAARAMRLSEEARHHNEKLERQHLQLRQAERMAQIGSWRLELADQSIHWSDHVYAIHGLPPGQMPSVEAALSYYPAERRAEIAELLERAATHAVSFDFESDFITADGRMRRVRSVGEPQIVDGRPVAVIGVFQDITERHAREVSLRQTADTDSLTGLANRACFESLLTETIETSKRDNTPCTLILLDLDGFKGVNDTFGHAVGDDVLRVTADRLRQINPQQGHVARLGGDEFVMLLTRPRDCARTEGVIGDILARLRHSVERDGERRAVSATVGAAVLEGSVENTVELMRRADLALYQAKRARRGTGRVFGTDVTLSAVQETVETG